MNKDHLSKIYSSELEKYTRLFPDHHSDLRDSDMYGSWLQTMQTPGANAVTHGIPWITYAARRFLERILTPGMRVFEWGAGGSTLYLWRNGCDITSIEHDAEWAAAVTQAGLAAGVVRVIAPEYAGHPADPVDPCLYATGDSKWDKFRFKQYASTISLEPDNSIDLVIVDGRARPSCIQHAMRHVRPGGFLLLDNSTRQRYVVARMLLEHSGWLVTRCPGAFPFSPEFGCTDFWQRQ